MGQSPSSLRSKSGRRSFRRFARQNKLNKSNLSHTFNMPSFEEYPELMNINNATEEQLMTLPGVNRQLARAIVCHRQMIGRFKRVDDLALVSGIGAEKLELMRPEICVNLKKSLSRVSSRTQSLESVKTSPDSRLCSINSASVFQLQCVTGLNQEIAANIVDYRNKKGPYKSLDDLIKVKGIDVVRLSTIKQYLSLELKKSDSIQQIPNGYSNGWCGDLSNGSVFNGVASTPKHRKSLSMPNRLPITLPNGFAAAPVNDILDLLSAYSHRPLVEENFCYERDGVKCCRLALWNLHELSIDKITNPGVREVVCRTILENRFSLLVVQDVVDELALRSICDELNMPLLRRVSEWKHNSQSWEYCVPAGNRKIGIIYENKGRASITIEDVDLDQLLLLLDGSESRRQLVDVLDRPTVEEWSVGVQVFLINSRPLIIISAVSQSEAKEMDWLHQAVSLSTLSGIQIAVMANLQKGSDVHCIKTLQSLINEDTKTTLDNTSGFSTILCQETSNFNGKAGLVKSGLSHLAIPRGWSWGGSASPHMPIWAEFNVLD